MARVFAKLLTAAPVNKAAALAVHVGPTRVFSVIDYPDSYHHRRVCWKLDPRFRREASEITVGLPDNRTKVQNLVGNKYGQMTVVGRLHPEEMKPLRRHGIRNGQWVVRCLCGRYELQNTSGVISGRRSKCGRCAAIDHRGSWKRGSVAPDIDPSKHT